MDSKTLDQNENTYKEYDSEIRKILGPINQENEETEQNDDKKSIFANKYLALFFMCSSVFGQNFIIDNPAALQDYLEDALKITNSQFASFYAFYGWSNIV